MGDAEISWAGHPVRQAPTMVSQAGPSVSMTSPSVSWGFGLLCLFTAWMWLQSLWAIDPDLHFEGCILFTKYVILFFVVERLVATEASLELFSWAHVGGCFWWGWQAYRYNGTGRLELEFGPGVADSNTLGFHLVTGLAFAGLMLVALPRRRRFLLLGMIPFILNGVILTASRGATLAMAAAAGGTLAFAPRLRRWVVYGGAALGIVLFLQLAGSELFWQRMGTMKVEEGEDLEASAASRFDIASANWRMFLDHPMGVGYRGNVALSGLYMPQWVLTAAGDRAAHNTYLAVLVDEGAPGLLLFVGLHLWALISLIKLKRLDRSGLSATLGVYRGAVAGGLIAYVVAGLFTNFITAEVGIWLLALIFPLSCLSRAAIQSAAPVPQPHAGSSRSLRTAAYASPGARLSTPPSSFLRPR